MKSHLNELASNKLLTSRVLLLLIHNANWKQANRNPEFWNQPWRENKNTKQREPAWNQNLFYFSEFSLAASSALPFTTLPTAAALAAQAAQAAQQAVAANNQVAVASPAPGKARSSMSLQLLSGR